MATETSTLREQRNSPAGLTTQDTGARQSALFTSRSARTRRENPMVPRSLGWLSLGLAAAACLAPGALSRLTGLRHRGPLLRAIGVRELVSGIGLLTQENPTPWLLSRVAGDAIDLAVALSALRASSPQRGRTLGTVGILAAVMAADLAASVQSLRASRSHAAADAYVGASVVVNRPAQECYDFWLEQCNLPRFIGLLQSIAPLDDGRSRWVIGARAGATLDWTVETTANERTKRVEWRSLGESGVQHAGGVRFETPQGVHGTLVRLWMHYRTSAGKSVLSIAKLLGADPQSLAREDLRRFKQLLEAGEIASTKGQPSGRRSVLGRLLPEGRLSRQRGLS